MKRVGFVIALIITGHFHNVAHADADVPVECFSSPEALHEAHPGSHAVYTAHATWWTESSKCWFVDKPLAKPKTKPRAAVKVAPVPSQPVAQALRPQPQQEVQGTYEENAAALRALMFGPDESPRGRPAFVEAGSIRFGDPLQLALLPEIRFELGERADFEGRFSPIGNTPTFSFWHRCVATPTWDLCRIST